MKESISAKLQILALLAFSVFWYSCENSETEVNEQEAGIDLDDEESKKLKTFLDFGLGNKAEWKSHWMKQLGAFEGVDFTLIQTDTIDPMEMPEQNPILPGDPLYPYQIPHPEGNGTMDIYSYKVEAQEGIDTPFLNPDSEVIYYRGDGMRERLLFMGPSGMFEEGLWLNQVTFLVFGYFQEEGGYRPMAWIIDLETHKVHRYQLTKTTAEYKPESYLDYKFKKIELG